MGAGNSSGRMYGSAGNLGGSFCDLGNQPPPRMPSDREKNQIMRRILILNSNPVINVGSYSASLPMIIGKGVRWPVVRADGLSRALMCIHGPNAFLLSQNEIACDARANGGKRVDHEFPAAGLESGAGENQQPAYESQNRRQGIQPHFERQPDIGLGLSEDKQSNRMPDELDEDTRHHQPGDDIAQVEQAGHCGQRSNQEKRSIWEFAFGMESTKPADKQS